MFLLKLSHCCMRSLYLISMKWKRFCKKVTKNSTVIENLFKVYIFFQLRFKVKGIMVSFVVVK